VSSGLGGDFKKKIKLKKKYKIIKVYWPIIPSLWTLIILILLLIAGSSIEQNMILAVNTLGIPAGIIATA